MGEVRSCCSSRGCCTYLCCDEVVRVVAPLLHELVRHKGRCVLLHASHLLAVRKTDKSGSEFRLFGGVVGVPDEQPSSHCWKGQGEESAERTPRGHNSQCLVHEGVEGGVTREAELLQLPAWISCRHRQRHHTQQVRKGELLGAERTASCDEQRRRHL